METIPKSETISLIGTVLGKSGYTPLEQMDTRLICAHSDLYALAATAIVLLTGKEPQQLIDPHTDRWHWQTKIMTPEKELASAAFAKGNYEKAVSLLSASLTTLPNDPEALIYWHNARIGREQSYSIAVSVPIGSNVNVAQEMLRGVAQAQHQINQAGGIDGIPLKVQIIDDENDPAVAQQVATTLSKNPEILGVVGDL